MLFSKFCGERKQENGKERGPPAGPSGAETAMGLWDAEKTPPKQPTQTSAFNITWIPSQYLCNIMRVLTVLASLCTGTKDTLLAHDTK